jgi:hypothetical protein
MRYEEFRKAIQRELARSRAGLTWVQLRDRLRLPYERACPAWTAQLEQEIGLSRGRNGKGGRALIWKLAT